MDFNLTITEFAEVCGVTIEGFVVFNLLYFVLFALVLTILAQVQHTRHIQDLHYQVLRELATKTEETE